MMVWKEDQKAEQKEEIKIRYALIISIRKHIEELSNMIGVGFEESVKIVVDESLSDLFKNVNETPEDHHFRHILIYGLSEADLISTLEGLKIEC